ncbi:hypothetical protein, partial [Massilia glaciei]|uniref:hypothetical protein n=1 Tax=Massilia glaciei TaxID=1524097 RepID=UPI001C6251C7
MIGFLCEYNEHGQKLQFSFATDKIILGPFISDLKAASVTSNAIALSRLVGFGQCPLILRCRCPTKGVLKNQV